MQIFLYVRTSVYLFTELPPVSNATVLLNTPNTLGYSITVNCTIHPNSSANQCVVMAMADGRVTITGKNTCTCVLMYVHMYVHTVTVPYVCGYIIILYYICTHVILHIHQVYLDPSCGY